MNDLNAGLTQVLEDGTSTYLYGIGRIDQTDETDTEYFLGDALGSLRQLTDASGAVTLTHSFDPYGNGISCQGNTSSIYGFDAEQMNSYNKLVNLHCRLKEEKLKTILLTLTILLAGLTLAGCNKPSSPTSSSPALRFEGQIAFCGKAENEEYYNVYLLDLATKSWKNLTKPFAYRAEDGFGHNLNNGFGNSIGCDDYMRPYRVTGIAWSPDGALLIVDSGGPT